MKTRRPDFTRQRRVLLTFLRTVLLAVLMIVVLSALAGASAPPFQRYLALDGSDDYADTPDQSELDVGQSLTIEAWINIQAGTDNSPRYIVYKAMAYELFQKFDPGTKRCLGFTLYTSSGTPVGSIRCKSSAYTFGWHHVALVYEKTAGSVRIYLDGTLFAQYTVAVSDLYNSTYPVKVGQHFASGIDEIRISGVARYASAFTPPAGPFACDGHTRALWHFDEAAGATVFHDACGADSVLQGRNGARAEGPNLRHLYLPVIWR